MAVVTALSIVAMLSVRRRAPEGSYFSDGDRASGVFGARAWIATFPISFAV